MKRNCIVFVSNLDENDFEHEEIVEFGYKNKSISNSIEFDIDFAYKLQYETKLLDIINEENSGILQVGEDDWIISNDIKSRILERLKKYFEQIDEIELKEIILKLIKFFEISIDTNHNIYFIF